MNIKLKALLLAIILVASPFVFVAVLVMYPLIILIMSVMFVIYLVYSAVLVNLERKSTRNK